MGIYHATSIGRSGYQFRAPAVAPAALGCALVAASGSGADFQMAWTSGAVQLAPEDAAADPSDYLAGDGTWKSIPTVDDSLLVHKAGVETITGQKTFSAPLYTVGIECTELRASTSGVWSDHVSSGTSIRMLAGSGSALMISPVGVPWTFWKNDFSAKQDIVAGGATFTGDAIATGLIATGKVTQIGTTLTNALRIGGLDGTPNYGMFLQTSNSTYPLLLQPAGGNVGIGVQEPDARFQVNTVMPGVVGLIVKGATSQTANLQEWQNIAGTLLASIGASGQLTAGVTTIGTGAQGIYLHPDNSGHSYVQVATNTAVRSAEFGFVDAIASNAWRAGRVQNDTNFYIQPGYPGSGNISGSNGLTLSNTGGLTIAGNLLGPSNFQVRAQTYLDLNIAGTTMLGIGVSSLFVAGTLQPSVDLGQDLGSTIRRWDDIYANRLALVDDNFGLSVSGNVLRAHAWDGFRVLYGNGLGTVFSIDNNGASTFIGDVVQTPSASITPANNGQLTFEATSNTALTVKYKGSDGTVRSVALTLA